MLLAALIGLMPSVGSDVIMFSASANAISPRKFDARVGGAPTCSNAARLLRIR
jgi:hypothetical protein